MMDLTSGATSIFFVQLVYEGEKEIPSLKAFPCEFWKEESKEGEKPSRSN